jgi:hypothetical protein
LKLNFNRILSRNIQNSKLTYYIIHYSGVKIIIEVFKKIYFQGLLEDKTPGKESAGALNAVLQFLFQECRNTKRVRAWFRHRLSVELEELNTRTTTGKLFDRIVVSIG